MDFHEHPVIFFDGVCGLCNAFVDFVLNHDHEEVFYFAPLQGDFAREIDALSPYRNSLSSVVLWKNGQVYTESTAAMEVFIALGGGWKIMRLFYLVPRFIRDFFYKLIARNRYKIFGKSETCRMPTPQERSRFL